MIIREKNGFALVVSIVVASIVLAIGLTLLNITVKQLTLSSISRESEISFQVASAGLDCLRFWSYFNTEFFREPVTTPGSAPVIGCFGNSPMNYGNESMLDPSVYTDGDSYTNAVDYQFEWGTGLGARCVEMEMYTMVASSSVDYEVDFSYSTGYDISDNIGDAGLKECLAGNICTVVVTRGYNRGCSEIQTSLIAVEREITAEF